MQYIPEQIQGKEADARSNIFAFGAMLYEMLRGKRAFEGKSQLSVASAILDLKLPLQWIAAGASQAGTPAIVTPRALSEPVSFCSQPIFGRFRRQFWEVLGSAALLLRRPLYYGCKG